MIFKQLTGTMVTKFDVIYKWSINDVIYKSKNAPEFFRLPVMWLWLEDKETIVKFF